MYAPLIAFKRIHNQQIVEDGHQIISTVIGTNQGHNDDILNHKTDTVLSNFECLAVPSLFVGTVYTAI